MRTLAVRLNKPVFARLELAGTLFWWLGIWGYTLLIVLGLSLGGMLNPNGDGVYLITAIGGVVGLLPLIVLSIWNVGNRRKIHSIPSTTRMVFRTTMILAIPGIPLCGLFLFH
jgi:hypothetical protein